MVMKMRIDFILNEMLKKLNYANIQLETTKIKELDKNHKNRL
jgi:hypothetical protein